MEYFRNWLSWKLKQVDIVIVKHTAYLYIEVVYDENEKLFITHLKGDATCIMVVENALLPVISLDQLG